MYIKWETDILFEILIPSRIRFNMYEQSVRAVYHHICCTKTKGCNAERMLSYFGITDGSESYFENSAKLKLCKKTRIRTGKNIMCKTCVGGTSASRYILSSIDSTPFDYYDDNFRCTYYYTVEEVRKIGVTRGMYHESLATQEEFRRCVRIRGKNKAGRCKKHHCHGCFEEPDRFRKSFYCFLMCSHRLGVSIPKDVRKMIHNMTRPVVEGIHTFYFPKKGQWYMCRYGSCPTASKAKICRQRTEECSVYTPRYNFRTWLTKTPHPFSKIPKDIESVEEFADLSMDDVIKLGAPDIAHAEAILFRAKKYGICEGCQKYELDRCTQEENKKIERFIEENLPRFSREVDDDDTYTEFVLKNLFKNPSIVTKKELDRRCKQDSSLGTHLWRLYQVKLPRKLAKEKHLFNGEIVNLCIERPHFYNVLKKELVKRLPVFAGEN